MPEGVESLSVIELGEMLAVRPALGATDRDTANEVVPYAALMLLCETVLPFGSKIMSFDRARLVPDGVTRVTVMVDEPVVPAPLMLTVVGLALMLKSGVPATKCIVNRSPSPV